MRRLIRVLLTLGNEVDDLKRQVRQLQQDVVRMGERSKLIGKRLADVNASSLPVGTVADYRDGARLPIEHVGGGRWVYHGTRVPAGFVDDSRIILSIPHV